MGVDDVKDAYIFDHCWSLHPKSNDLAPGIPTDSKSSFMGRNSSHAVSLEFACHTMRACFESDLESNPWWRGDLGTPKSVRQVRIHYHSLLDPVRVEFRLGNDPFVVNNPLFVTSPSIVPNEEVILTPPIPVTGRYFFVTEPMYGDIRVCDMWIIGTHTDENWRPHWIQ